MGITLALTPQEIADLKAANLVVIIGMPASGKTTVANFIANTILPDHSIYHSDDYIDYGYEESLYAMIKDMGYDQNPKKIVEGVQGYRFLRKTLERDIVVDCIVDVQCAPDLRAKRYAARKGKNLPSAFDKNLQKVQKDYTDALAKSAKKPRIITLYT